MSSLTTRAFAASVAVTGLILSGQVAASAAPVPEPMMAGHVASITGATGPRLETTRAQTFAAVLSLEPLTNSAVRQGIMNKINAAALSGINLGSG